MADKQIPVGLAFPIAEGHRKLMRQLIPEMPFPKLYREGAETRPCTECGMRLNVGPRLLKSGLPIYCPVCAQHLAESHNALNDLKTYNLDNPESASEVHCMDCDRRYEDFPLDVVLPDADWAAIHPTGPGGVLCASCIVARAAKIGNVVVIRAQLERAH